MDEPVFTEPRIGVTRKGSVPVEKYPHGDIHWLVRARTNGARELTVGVTTLPVGDRSPLHRHPNCEEVTYLLSGEIDQVIEGSPNLRMKAGDTILIPRDLKHQAINAGDAPAELLVCFSTPQRQTILEDHV